MLEHLFPRTTNGTLIRIRLRLGCSRGRPATTTKGKGGCRHPPAVAVRRSERGSGGGDGDWNGVALVLALALALILLCREGQGGESGPLTAVGAESTMVSLSRRTAHDGAHETSKGGWGSRGVSHVIWVCLIFAEPALVLVSRNGGGDGGGAAQIDWTNADATMASRRAAWPRVLGGRWSWYLSWDRHRCSGRR